MEELVAVAKWELLPNGWTDVTLRCANEECEGFLHVGECFYDENEVLKAVKKETVQCSACHIEVNIPNKLWIQ